MASPSRLPYQPALDGLRGLAVAAVLAYHAELSWARGGFLGVDAFFVLSGYLITSLLLFEWNATGKLQLAAFWARRARRLLPALFLMLAGVAVYAVAFAEPEELDKIRGDGLATLAYFANWRFIISGTSYFDQFAVPSPLRHAWSLAIEEQFYLVWPLVFVLLMKLGRGSPRALAAVSLILIAGSALLMAWLYSPGVDPSRVYYGTDTRAHSLLVGVVLAVVLLRSRLFHADAPRILLQCAAMASAVLLGWMWVRVSDDSSFLYNGGYLLLAIAVAVVIAAVVQPKGSPLGKLLAMAPLRGLGLISYGVYLWHWPLYLMLTAERTGLDGASLLTVRVAVTLAISLVSYYAIEIPIRRGTLRWPRASWAVAPATMAALVIVLIVVTRGGAPPYAVPDESVAAQLPLEFNEEAIGEATRILMVGDSISRSMSVGLYELQAEFGYVLRDLSVDGCGMMPGDVRHREYSLGSQCSAVRERWRPHIDLFQPDVVVLMTSPWDGVGREVDGRVVQGGTPEWESNFRKALQDAIDTLSERGARVVLLTAPYVSPFAIEPETVDRLNDVGSVVARENGSRITTIDLNSFLSIDGDYSREIDDVQVRSNDDVHFTEDGARFVGAWLAPKLIQAAELATVVVDGSESLSEGADSTYALGLAGDGNFLLNADAIGPDAWRGWRSTLRHVDDGILVSSDDIAYSALLSTNGTDMNLMPGQTYVALAWIRTAAEPADGQIEIIVREEGAKEGESLQIYGQSNIWQPILVEHTVTRPNLASLEIHLLRLGEAAGNDAFVFRDAQLRLTSE